MRSRRKEGGLHEVEETALKSVARHSKIPCFQMQQFWRREMEGWDFHNAFIGD